MKILFAYRYGALGGVPTQLINRMHYLRGVPEVSAEFLFARDYGIAPALSKFGPVHIEPEGKKLKKLVEARRYDVVAIIDTEEYLEALRDLGPKPAVVLEVHTTIEFGLTYLERSWSPAGYIVPSTYSRNLLAERYNIAGARVHVVPNIIDPELFAPVPVDRPPERPILLWVGRLDDHKDWQAFLQVGSLLALQTSDVELWLVGGETAPEAIQLSMLETVEGLALMPRFRWFPRIDYGAMPRVYSYVAASGGCALVTSKDESFGMSIAEALLSGCPVVSSKVGAVPELAPESAYLHLYPLGELWAAAELVRRTIFEDRRLARRALQTDRPALAERFSPNTIGPQYLRTLRELA